MAGAKGLGRGLDVLMRSVSLDEDHPEVTILKIENIRPNPRQPRQEFDPQTLQDLASSIKEQGVLQPILVRSTPGGGHGYELVAGERRLRASKLAGLEEIPCIVREVTDEQSLALALIENLQRENLNALEEARGLDQLLRAFTLNQESLAQKLGKSRSAVANSLRLLQLPQPIQESLFVDAISAGHARALLSVTEPSAQEELWSQTVSRGLSVRETEDIAKHWKQYGDLPKTQVPQAQPERSRRLRAPLPEKLAQLAATLRERFNANVKLGGTSDHGRITFSYSSIEELKALLEAWQVDASDA